MFYFARTSNVIDFRKKLPEPESARHVLLSGSVLDEGWVAEVKRRARRRILFVAEGLSPYFTEAQHKTVFGYLTENFPGQEMLFQTHAPSVFQDFVHLSDLSKLRTGAELRCGLEESALVSSLDPKARFLAEFSLLEG